MGRHTIKNAAPAKLVLRLIGACLLAGECLAMGIAELDVHEALALSYPATMTTIAITALFCVLALVCVFSAWRIARIERVLTQLSQGVFSARSGVSGSDPVGRLGRQLDEVVVGLAEERQRLLDSEERLKVALHGCDIAVWDWRLDTGVTYYSPHWLNLLGFSPDTPAMSADAWLKRVHPDDLALVTQALDRHTAGESEFFVCEHRLQRRDGRYIWVQQSGVASRNTQGEVVRMIGALADISRRKDAERALVQSREDYRLVLEGVTEVIFRTDAQGRFDFLNPAWSELTGHPFESSLGSRLLDYVDEQEKDRISAFYKRVGEDHGLELACELRLRCKGSTWRWFSLHLRARPLADSVVVAGVLSDLEAQKCVEAALQHSNMERDAILRLGPDGFVFVDDAGCISFVNPAFVEMTGLQPEDVVGETLAALDQMLGIEGSGVRGFAQAVDDGGDGLLQLEGPPKVVIRWLLRVLPDAGGGVHGRVVYLRDITRESEIDRMKSDFLSTAAHELRTPMSSIFGFSELLLSREFDAASQRDLLERIHRQTKNLINLVNELLDLSRIEARGGKSFKMQVQDLTPVVLNALAAQYVPAETHRLEFDWPKKLPKARIDGEKFQQCVINVLSNAIKYSPKGGTVRVSAAHRGEGPAERLGVAIADPGLGMTPEQKSRIFERFYRADPSGSILGTGLGMSLVKEYMNIFGGEVEVESEVGQGTRVTLWLPVIHETEKALAP